MRVLAALLLAFSLSLSLNAQTFRSFYFTVPTSNGTETVTYVRAYLQPGMGFLLTHDKNVACISFSTREMETNQIASAALDYWYGDTNVLLAPQAPEFRPYYPPERTAAELARVSLLVSNRVWLVDHPAMASAKPKTGNKPVTLKALISPPKMP